MPPGSGCGGRRARGSFGPRECRNPCTPARGALVGVHARPALLDWSSGADPRASRGGGGGAMSAKAEVLNISLELYPHLSHGPSVASSYSCLAAVANRPRSLVTNCT